MNYHDRLKAIEEYAAKRGISLATLGNFAANNARLVFRTQRRVKIAEGDLARLEEYIRSNPIEAKHGAAAGEHQGEVAS